MDLVLKKVNYDDCDLLFNWANDIEVRINSLSKDIIEYSKHVKWFNEKIKNYNTYIFIVLKKNVPIGQVRIDVYNHIGTIDYSIDRNFRGYGYGNEIIRLLEEEIYSSKIDIHRLFAVVKYTNIASQKVFEHNRFKRINKEKFVEYLKDL